MHIKNLKINILIPIVIFVFFTCITLSIKFIRPELTTPDDPYYHARISASMLLNERVEYPAFSSLTPMPVDLYYMYHLLMSPFTYGFKGDNFQALIDGVKVYHSIIEGLFFLVFYLILFNLLKRKSNINRNIVLGICGTLLLFIISTSFTTRIMLERPHNISIIAMLCAFYFIFTENWKGLFLVAFLLPFFYSTSFFLLIPAVIYIVSSYFSDKIITIKKFIPTIVTVSGLICGIIIRPDSIAYVYNGYIVPILSLGNALLPASKQSYVIGELQNNNLHLINDYWIIIFLIIWVFTFLNVIRNRKSINSKDNQNIFLLIISILFIVGLFAVQRMIEYTIPFVVLFTILNYDIWSNELKSIPIIKGMIIDWEQFPINIKKIIRNLLLVLFFLYIYVQIAIFITGIEKREWNDGDAYRGAVTYLKQNIEKDGIVYIPNFSLYPRLFFYEPTLKYSSGMDPMFEIVYNKSLFKNIDSLKKDKTSIDFLRDKNVEYFFLNTKYYYSNEDRNFENILIENNLREVYRNNNILIYGFK